MEFLVFKVFVRFIFFPLTQGYVRSGAILSDLQRPRRGARRA